VLALTKQKLRMEIPSQAMPYFRENIYWPNKERRITI
jgi:hypothetical protein